MTHTTSVAAISQAEGVALPPALRHRKQQSIQSVVNVAVHLYNAGEWDAYCDSITKLLGMADAFHDLDDGLFNYAMDCVNALSRFTLQNAISDFNAWASVHASDAVRVGA